MLNDKRLGFALLDQHVLSGSTAKPQSGGRISAMARQTVMAMGAETQGLQTLQYEFIDSKELASRWALPESWIREQVRSRAADPLPHIRFGKYVRFRWGSPEMEGWAERRIINASNRDVGRVHRKEI